MDIIGEKSLFAIQFQIKENRKKPWGNIILWINNISVGNWIDEDYLLNIQSGLERNIEMVKKSNPFFFFK